MASGAQSQSASSASLPASMPQDSTSASPREAALACRESIERVQLVSDLLLLQSGRGRPAALQPASEGKGSYGMARDAIVATTKTLAISIKLFGQRLRQSDASGVQSLAQRVADQVILLAESSAHAAYFAALTDAQSEPASPPPVDRYTFCRGRQALQITGEKLRAQHGPLSEEQVMTITRTFADNLALITQGCNMASENRTLRPADRAQFSQCAQGLQGCTAAFLPSLKAFASSRSPDARTRCSLFSRPLLQMVDCVVEFSLLPQFSGTPARLSDAGHRSQTDILAGAVGVVGGSVQLLRTGQALLEAGFGIHEAASHWQSLVKSSKAVASANRFLCSALRVHTPLPSASPSRSSSLETFVH